MTEQEKFMRIQFWANSAAAALGHSKAYLEETSDDHHQSFRKRMNVAVEEISTRYVSKRILENEHLENIESIVSESQEFANILTGGRLTFGVAQKMLNVYLKFLWCTGLVGEPPHCPLDSRILGIVGWHGKGFTQMNRAEYIEAIKKIRETSAGKSLAQWELESYNRILN